MTQEPPPEEELTKEEREDQQVLVFRNNQGAPVAAPSEVVTQADRAYRCYQGRIGGKSWAQVAEEEGYNSPGAAKADVDRYMAEARSLVVESSAREMLTMEVARLDALQSALWGQAMAGHVPSASLVMNIVVNRSRLVGLDPEKMGEESSRARTVVVSGDSSSYVQQLQRQAGPPGQTDDQEE